MTDFTEFCNGSDYTRNPMPESSTFHNFQTNQSWDMGDSESPNDFFWQISRDNVVQVEKENGDTVPRQIDMLARSDSGLYCYEETENLILYSQDFSQPNWIKSGGSSVLQNASTAPDGTNTATRLTTGVDYFLRQIYTNISEVPLTTYTFSTYVKGEGANVGMMARIYITRNSGAWIGVPNDFILTGEWQRVEATVTFLASNTSIRCAFSQPIGAGASEYLIWGAQLEKQNHCSPYLVTSANSDSVSSQLVSSTISNLGFGDTEGMIVFDQFTSKEIPTTDYLFLFKNNTVYEGYFMRRNSANNYDIIQRTMSLGDTVVIGNITGIVDGNRHKIAFGWKLNNFNICIDGGLIVSAISSDGLQVPSEDTVYIGSDDGSGQINSKILNVATYNAWDDAKAQQRTTI